MGIFFHKQTCCAWRDMKDLHSSNFWFTFETLHQYTVVPLVRQKSITTNGNRSHATCFQGKCHVQGLYVRMESQDENVRLAVRLRERILTVYRLRLSYNISYNNIHSHAQMIYSILVTAHMPSFPRSLALPTATGE